MAFAPNFPESFPKAMTDAVKVIAPIKAPINNSNQCAFTLTGPYGTGKSSLALFLQALLSNLSATIGFIIESGTRLPPDII